MDCFKKFKDNSSNLLWFLKHFPPFVRLSFALGCCKPVMSKAEHLQKQSTPEVRTKNLMGQVFEAQKFPLRKKVEISKIERRREKNLTLKFSIACCVIYWCFPLPFIGYKSYNQEKKEMEWESPFGRKFYLHLDRSFGHSSSKEEKDFFSFWNTDFISLMDSFN